MTFETTDGRIGSLSVSPARVRAGEPFGLELTYTVGEARITPGGCVRFQIPQACPDPQLRSPVQPGFCRVSCTNPEARWTLSLVRTGHPKDRAYVTVWGKNVFAELAEGCLERGDRVTLRYGMAASEPEAAFAEVIPTRAPFFSGEHHCSAAADPDGSRAAPYSGMTCAPYGRLTVLPGEAVKTVRVSCLRGEVRIGLDREDNPVRAEWTAGGPARAARDRQGILFGDMHCHSGFSDGIGTPEDCYRFARDVIGLDFCAVTDHAVQMSDAEWLRTMEANDRWNEDGRFLTLLGYELNHRDSNDKNIYYPGSEGELLRDRAWGTWDGWIPPETHVGQWLRQGALIMSHLHEGRLGGFDHPELCRLVEIYSNWGNCEQEGAYPTFIPALRRDFAHQWAVDALRLGRRVGFTANSDDHMARPGWSGWHRVERTYRSGLTGVYAKEPTREALFEALYRRRTCATTGPRILIEARMDGELPGGGIPAASGHEIRFSVRGYTGLEAVELVRYGAALETIRPDAPGCEGSFSVGPVTDPLYLRVRCRDGHTAWTSPWYPEP